MSIYRKKGGKTWYMKFTVRGQLVRQSTGTRTKALAEQIERDTHRTMEREALGIPEVAKVPLFGDAADQWLDFKQGDIEASTLGIHKSCLRNLRPVFTLRLLSTFSREEIKSYQRQRIKDGARRKTVNLEIETLRAILIHFGQWERIKRDVKMFKQLEEDEVGRELSDEEQEALLEACQMSRSRLLYYMVVVALETGARDKTIKQLRWKWVDFQEKCLRWGKDKTPAGSGRVVPLNSRALAVLEFWASLFPNRRPDHFVFPFETYSGSTKVAAHNVDPTQHIKSVKTAWNTAKRTAGWILAGRPESRADIKPLVCRFHDLRHTAESRMIRNTSGNIPLVGRVMGWSASTMVAMAKKYSHFRVDELRNAMETPGCKPLQNGASTGAQNGALPTPQSGTTGDNQPPRNNGVTQ